MCGKKKYKKREDAISVLWTATKSRSRKRKEKRVYFCDPCQAYHLTSKGDVVSTRQVSRAYVQEVLYGKQIRERLRLKHYDFEKELEKARLELHKRIDWRLYVEKLKEEKKNKPSV